MRLDSIRYYAERGKEFVEGGIPKEVPKPFTVPPGWVPPTMGEQWLYAMRRHPYSQYGAAAAFMLGLVGYGLATGEKSQKKKGSEAEQSKDGSEASNRK